MNSVFHEITVAAAKFQADLAIAKAEEQFENAMLDAARHRMTTAETSRKAQLLALFDKSDARGQDLLLAIAAIHATRYPKGA